MTSPDSDALCLEVGQVVAGKYRVLSYLGGGWEGKVYLVREIATGVIRAAKLFYPQRNRNDRALKFYAKKLHKLRDCPIVVQYVTQEKLQLAELNVSCLITEYAEGEVLTDFLKKSGRLHAFEALHLVHSLATGLSAVHQLREAHGDLHPGNVIVRRHGLQFEVKIIDFFEWQTTKPDQAYSDVKALIDILYAAIGGAKYYKKAPRIIKDIVRGRKDSLIFEKFKSPLQLREHIENLSWD